HAHHRPEWSACPPAEAWTVSSRPRPVRTATAPVALQRRRRFPVAPPSCRRRRRHRQEPPEPPPEDRGRSSTAAPFPDPSTRARLRRSIAAERLRAAGSKTTAATATPNCTALSSAL